MVKTRDNNKSIRPGLKAQKVTRSRCPKSEVQAECEVKEADQAKRRQQEADAKKRASEIDHPTETINGPCQRRPRPRDVSVVQDAHNVADSHDMVVTNDVPEDEVEELMPSANDEHLADSEYSNEDVELENNEPDTELSKQSSRVGTRADKGLQTRKEINKLAAEADKENMGHAGTRRKQAVSINTSDSEARTVPTKKKLKKANTHPTGVLHGWENQAINHPLPASVQSRTFMELTIASSHTYNASEDAVREGGISSDDDEVEQSEVPDQISTTRYGSQVLNVKISQLHSVKHAHKPSSRPTHRLLPAGTEHKFKTVAMTRVYDHMGAAEPWTSLNENVATDIWNSVFPDHPICPNGRAGDRNLFIFVYRLMCRDIQNNWIHGLANAGLKAVQDELKERELFTLEERAEFVKKLIGDAGQNRTIHQKDHPFLWQSVYTEGETQRGLFRGNLVTRTLAHHIMLVSVLEDDNFSPCSKPKGALVMAILSALCALALNITGREEIPSGTGSNFSYANWADADAFDPTSRKIKRQVHHTFWNRDIKDLKSRIWECILEDATNYYNTRKRMDDIDAMEVEMDVDIKAVLYDPDQESDSDT
ncbi:hypothetical protein BDQ17DRAFT_1548510 [Cyathus striatus]|nr:hypothetical protein BDQ17DRAFT_1548510 [Cyathus striatus]